MGIIFPDVKEDSHKSYTEIFEEQFPFYLSIGMSSAEYWNGDCSLTQYFRKAYLLRQEEKNYSAWLQGLYVYNAVSTVVHNAFKSKNDPSTHYVEKPYDLNNREETEEEKERKVEIEQEKAFAWMENFVRVNKRA